MQDCPRASANISSLHYGDLVFRSGYLWSEGWLQYRAAGIIKAYSVEVKAALPRNELVYLSGPCQLNICLRDFLQFMKKGHIEGSRGGSSLFNISSRIMYFPLKIVQRRVRIFAHSYRRFVTNSPDFKCRYLLFDVSLLQPISFVLKDAEGRVMIYVTVLTASYCSSLTKDLFMI